MNALLTIDAGSTSVKIAAFDESLTILTGTVRKVTLTTLADGGVEFDPQAYWLDVCSGVREVVSRLGSRCRPVAMAISSHTDTLIAVDEQGRVLRPGIFWYDGRAAPQARQIAAEFPGALFRSTTGQSAPSAMMQGAKLRWLIEQDPEVAGRTAHFCQTSDFLALRLTGRVALDTSIACCTGMFALGAGGYWPAMLEHIGVAADRLPELVEPGQPIGPLTAEAERLMGIRDVVLVGGAMDQTAAALACGNISGGIVSECTGAALAVGATVDRVVCDPQGVVPCFRHAVPGKFLLLPYSPTGGMALQWFRDGFYADRGRLEGDDVYAAMTAEASEIGAGSDGLTALPYLAGGDAPDYDPTTRAAFLGATLSHRRGHFVRALLEAVAFMLRQHVESLARMGVAVSEVRSIGGGARSELWGQIKADVLNLPVVRMLQSEMSSAGAAVLAGVGAGLFASVEIAVASLAATGHRHEPEPQRRAAYEAAYAAYRRMQAATRGIYGRHDP